MDKLSGRPFPAISRWVFQSNDFLVGVPFLVILICIGALVASKARQMPYYIAAIGMVVVGIYMLICLTGAVIPLFGAVRL